MTKNKDSVNEKDGYVKDEENNHLIKDEVNNDNQDVIDDTTPLSNEINEKTNEKAFNEEDQENEKNASEHSESNKSDEDEPEPNSPVEPDSAEKLVGLSELELSELEELGTLEEQSELEQADAEQADAEQAEADPITSDDEEIVALEDEAEKNDVLLEKDYLSSLLEQKDRLVYYEVENIYRREDKRLYRNKYRLKKDPPVLVIRDDEENEVRFYLTENLTDELSETLKQVKRAYFGFSGPSDMDMPKGFFNKVKYYITNNPLKILAGIVVIVFFVNLFL